ncbi:hypothetical protein AKUG0406_14790 [Apilactobacillus kunkeei]|nr:hypothetical protein AKUG0406_14790 [Apilactobacillus kunkeei]CAI2669816.1 hypothetical protein AKUG0403_14780 [Apilactobacillus kunkeei]CAI2676448.1 hypothetical protein AKUG0420_15020 [Apilactobacillus kunkeei]
MDKKTKKRLINIAITGIVIGFMSELALTILYSWQIDFIKSSYIYFGLSIILMVAIGLLIIYMFLRIIMVYPLGSNFHYLLHFAVYDVSILIGGSLGKVILTQVINSLK